MTDQNKTAFHSLMLRLAEIARDGMNRNGEMDYNDLRAVESAIDSVSKEVHDLSIDEFNGVHEQKLSEVA